MVIAERRHLFPVGRSRHSRGEPGRHPDPWSPEGVQVGPRDACTEVQRASFRRSYPGSLASLGTPKHSLREQAGPRVRGHGALPNCHHRFVPEGTVCIRPRGSSRQASTKCGRVSSASPRSEDQGDQPNVLQLSASVAASSYPQTPFPKPASVTAAPKDDHVGGGSVSCELPRSPK
jgi:hypothetical protein